MNKNAQKNINLLLIFLALIIIGISAYAFFRIYSSERKLIPISVVAIIAGVMFEGRRLSEKWSTFLWTTLGAFVFSFLCFLPDKRETNYNLENHLEIWPYWYAIIFAIFSICANYDKVIPRLTEGITLLQSIAIIYWVIDYGFLSTGSVILQSLMVIGLLYSIFALLHAFTYSNLSRTNRLALSIWSSLIMLLFALDNIYRVYQNEEIEYAINNTNAFYIGLQFFLLGASSIYIIQNALMIFGFLPGKGSFFNSAYFREINQLKEDHVQRYSDDQVYIGHSIICLIFAVTVFGLNYYYQILPRHIAIWFVFITFPLLLRIASYKKKKRYY